MMATNMENSLAETPDTPASPDLVSVGEVEAMPEINLEQLAEKVYRLMRAEARLGQARGQQ